MTREDKIEIHKIVLESFKDIYFEDDMDDCSYYEYFEEGIEHLNWTHAGASKGVFNLSSLDNWVVKIPFLCADENYRDYCKLETSIYHDARRKGISAYFAEEVYIGKINDYPFYIQKEAIPWESGGSTWGSEEYERRCELGSKYYKGSEFFDEEWIGLFIECYGEMEYLKLEQFIEENGINDLHDGNYGITAEGDPILFDYSGF